MRSWRTLQRAGRDSLSRALIALCAFSLALTPAPMVWAQTAARPGSPAGGETVMLNFVNADIDAVVRAIGQFTGRTFVVDPRIKGTLTLVTERPVTRQQSYEQLLTALRLQGFTIVQTGNVMRVLPEADAKLQGGTVIGPRESTPGGDQLVTQVFRLQYESVTAMVPILRPLIAPNNTISAYPQNNTLVITDYADNLKRIARIIETIDTPATSDVEIVQLKFGLAGEIGTIVNRVLDESARAAGQSSDAGQRISVLAEPRTNTLILRAPSQARMALAKSLIERLDRPALTPGNINVVYLRNAEAVRLAPLLRAIIGSDPSYVPQGGGSGLSGGGGAAPGQGQPGGTPPAAQAAPASAGGGGSSGPLAGMIQADGATNSLIITAPEPLYRNIRAIIDKLDARRAQVVIESLIVEMTADKAIEFGIQWQALGGVDKSGNQVIAGTNFGGPGTNIVGASQNLASLGQGLNLGVISGKVTIPGVGEILNLAFLARALETTADANILSTPTIQTLDNEEAKFLVGQNIPLVTGAYANAGAGGGVAGVNPFQTFERKDIGLQLRVKPQISEGGVVRLAIYQELSSIQNTLTASQGGIITNKRSFESTVLVEDGNIVVLGGLIEDRTDNSQSAVPILGGLPLIGGLFRYENRGRKKTNLLVFLRPYVIRDEIGGSTLALDRYAYIRGQIAANTAPETFIFKDIQGRQLPETPPMSPSQRRSLEQQNVPVLTAPSMGLPAPAPGATFPESTPTPVVPSPFLPSPQPEKPKVEAPPAPSSAAPIPVPDTVVAVPAPSLTARAAPAPVRPPALASPAPAPTPVPIPPAPVAAPVQAPTPAPQPEGAAPSAPVVAASASPAPEVRTVAPTAQPSPVASPSPAPIPTSIPAQIPVPSAVPSAAPSPTVASAPASQTSLPPAAPASGSFSATSGAPAPGAVQLLQVAAVSDIARGRDLQRQLREAGFDAYWESVRNTSKKADVVRVRVSVDPAIRSMADTLARLKSMGFEPIIVSP